MTNTQAKPEPEERAVIGRALGLLNLDHRPGVGLRADGVPDIDWVTIPDRGPFVYQRGTDGERTLRVRTFQMARYLITHGQFQAFIDAGGYDDPRWWQGLARRIKAPETARWREPSAPRETVSWYEALAYCRWLAASTGLPVTLPTEVQWERAAAGSKALGHPWSRDANRDFRSGSANCDEAYSKQGPHCLGRTSVVGLYPDGRSEEGVLDLTGNVWEWCLNDFDVLDKTDVSRDARRAVRGGAWNNFAGICRSTQATGTATSASVSCVAPFKNPEPGIRLLGLRRVKRGALGQMQDARLAAQRPVLDQFDSGFQAEALSNTSPEMPGLPAFSNGTRISNLPAPRSLYATGWVA